MRILLLSQLPADKNFFEAVASKSSLSFQHFSTAVALVDDLARDASAIVVVDASNQGLFSAFENCVSDKIGLYSAVMNPNYFFYITSQPFYAATYLHESQVFGNHIQRNYHESEQKILAQIFGKFAKDSAFEVEKYFSPMAKLQLTKIKKSTDKYSVVEALKDYLLRWGMNSRATAIIANAADEIIMNAVYEAPIDGLGKQLYVNTARNAPIELDAASPIEFKVVHDDECVAISVMDSFGSLDRAKVISLLGKVYRDEEYKIKPNVAGAGIGFSDTFYHSGGLVVASEPGVKTEVILFYKKTESFKDFREQIRFMGCFTAGV